METFKDRLRVEYEELSDKIEKLESFLKSDVYREIEKEQQILLRSQCAVMIQYRDILKKRLELLN